MRLCQSVCLSVSWWWNRMQLTPFCFMLSCLQVSPDRSQFFRYDSISLSCEDPLNSTGWKVKRMTPGGGVRVCSNGWGFISSSSTCIIGNTYPSDSGVYWCESDDGETVSNSVNITITDRAVMLESPALPVSEGDAVILRCKAETRSSDHRFNFYKDGRAISVNSTGEMKIHRALKSDEGLYKCGITGGGESFGSWLAVEGRAVLLEIPALPVSEGDAVILRCRAKTNSSDHRFEFFKDGQSIGSGHHAMTIHTVSKSDEGLYKCSISGVGESISNWLAVQASVPPSSPAPSAASSSVPVSRLMCHLMVGTPYLLSTILLGLIYRDRKRAARIIAERRGSDDVIMEIVV